jgi:crotonobetainyl-CoA:carnitine CoA-transferase CaiB-like acyl-CoA transferase
LTRVQAVLGVSDPYSDNPQRPPRDDSERQFRASLKDRMAAEFAGHSVAHWLERLRASNVPCGVVRTLQELHADPQAVANGLVQKVHQPGLGEVSLLGSLFKIDGVAKSANRAAPALGAHQEEVLGSLTTMSSEGQ